MILWAQKPSKVCSSFVFLSPHLCFHSLSILLSQSSSGTRIPMWSLFNTRSSFRGVSLIALKSYPNNFSILVFTPFFFPIKIQLSSIYSFRRLLCSRILTPLKSHPSPHRLVCTLTSEVLSLCYGCPDWMQLLFSSFFLTLGPVHTLFSV